MQKTTGINPLKLNMDWPSVRMDDNGTWPPLNPNWFKQQELMSKVGPFIGGLGIGMGGGAAPAGGQAAAAAPAEEKKDAPAAKVEKTHYDIELIGFDAAKKINLIKEVRTIFGLGLKEAKDMVEKIPNFLKRNCVAADADDIKAKLEAVGAQIKFY